MGMGVVAFIFMGCRDFRKEWASLAYRSDPWRGNCGWGWMNRANVSPIMLPAVHCWPNSVMLPTFLFWQMLGNQLSYTSMPPRNYSTSQFTCWLSKWNLSELIKRNGHVFNWKNSTYWRRLFWAPPARLMSYKIIQRLVIVLWPQN